MEVDIPHREKNLLFQAHTLKVVVVRIKPWLCWCCVESCTATIFAISTQPFFCVGSQCESLQGPRKPPLDLHMEGGAILNVFGLWNALPDVRDQRGDLHRLVYGPLQCGRAAKSHQSFRVSLAGGDAHDHPDILPWRMSAVCVFLGTRAHVAASNTCCRP